jgi:hypothetical protein
MEDKEYLTKLEGYIVDYKQLLKEFKDDDTWFKPWLRLQLRSCQIEQKMTSLRIYYDGDIPFYSPRITNQMTEWFEALNKIEKEIDILLGVVICESEDLTELFKINKILGVNFLQ